MVKNQRRIDIMHDNSHDISEVEFSISEIKKLDNKLLNKINRQNRK